MFMKSGTSVRSLVCAWVSREKIEHQGLGEMAYVGSRALARAQSLWVFRVHWVLPRVHYKESVNTRRFKNITVDRLWRLFDLF
jgi:hypothetical protein